MKMKCPRKIWGVKQVVHVSKDIVRDSCGSKVGKTELN